MSKTRPDILTFTGKYFNFLNPEPEMICIEDIAHGLSNLCRFNGQCRQFYSVAEHSVNVSELVNRRIALEALLHDAAESYIGDMTRPLKQLLPEYKEIEKKIEAVIRQRFNLSDFESSKAIKYADVQMLLVEQQQIMPYHDDMWGCLEGVTFPSKAIRIKGYSPETAKQIFMNRFNIYSTEREL